MKISLETLFRGYLKKGAKAYRKAQVAKLRAFLLDVQKLPQRISQDDFDDFCHRQDLGASSRYELFLIFQKFAVLKGFESPLSSPRMRKKPTSVG